MNSCLRWEEGCIPANGSTRTPDGDQAHRAKRAVAMSAGDQPARVSLERILRLRQVMPDESPIDLDAHAAMVALDVERTGSYAEVMRRREASIEVTREYVESVRLFLNEIRQSSNRV